MPYIYKIYNDINSSLYIGKTEDTIKNRWAKHVWACQNEPHNYKLYNAMNKYGINNFHIVEVEECSSEQLAEKERYWIKYYDSYKNGYNLTPGGEGCPIYDRENILSLWQDGYSQKEISEIVGCERHTVSRILKSFNIPEEELHKFKNQGNNSKEILLLDKNTLEIIKEFKSSAEALRFLNLDPIKCSSLVSRACKNLNNSAYGYKWILKEDYKQRLKTKQEK